MSHRSVAQFALGHRPAPAAGAEFGNVPALRTGHGLPRRRLHQSAIFGRHDANVGGRIHTTLTGCCCSNGIYMCAPTYQYIDQLHSLMRCMWLAHSLMHRYTVPHLDRSVHPTPIPVDPLADPPNRSYPPNHTPHSIRPPDSPVHSMQYQHIQIYTRGVYRSPRLPRTLESTFTQIRIWTESYVVW